MNRTPASSTPRPGPRAVDPNPTVQYPRAHRPARTVLHRRDDQLAVLVGGVAARDQADFTRLYDLTSARVHSFALRIVRSPDHAAEVTQEVFLQVWRQAAARYAPSRGGVLPWLMMITHGKAVEVIRSTAAARQRDTSFVNRDHDPDGDTVWDAVAERWDRRQAVCRVTSVIATLSLVQRQALALTYAEGLTQPQIAARLGLPLGTVKTRIRDARLAVERALRARPQGS